MSANKGILGNIGEHGNIGKRRNISGKRRNNTGSIGEKLPYLHFTSTLYLTHVVTIPAQNSFMLVWSQLRLKYFAFVHLFLFIINNIYKLQLIFLCSLQFSPAPRYSPNIPPLPDIHVICVVIPDGLFPCFKDSLSHPASFLFSASKLTFLSIVGTGKNN